MPARTGGTEPAAGNPPAEMPTDERERLLLELGRALHRHGTPAHRIERALERVAAKLGLQASFFAVPTAIIAAFGAHGAQRAGLVRLDPGSVDLGKLARLDDQVKALAAGGQSPRQGLAEIERISTAESAYPRWLVLACFGASSGAGARFFGGGTAEIVVAALVGLLLGSLAGLFSRKASPALFVPLAAFLSAALAHLGQVSLGAYRVEVVTVAGLLFLLPGLTLTVALTELSTRHLVAGTARLTSAMLTLLELGFGIALGTRVGELLPASTVVAPTQLPGWSLGVAVVIAATCYTVLFSARWQDVGWVIAACALAFFTSRAASAALGPSLGAWVAAVSVGVACNAYARLLNRPPAVPLVPAVLLLVPGSIGMHSITLLLRSEADQAVSAAFNMGMVGIALAVGMLMANVVLSPKRSI